MHVYSVYMLCVVDRKAERQALQLLQRAEQKQRDELEQRTVMKRNGLNQQLDQRRQVCFYTFVQTVMLVLGLGLVT